MSKVTAWGVCWCANLLLVPLTLLVQGEVGGGDILRGLTAPFAAISWAMLALFLANWATLVTLSVRKIRAEQLPTPRDEAPAGQTAP